MRISFGQQNCYVIRYTDRFRTFVYKSGYQRKAGSISNIIQQIINHNRTFVSARNCVIAQLRVSVRENPGRAI